jgi:hypothetical protein
MIPTWLMKKNLPRFGEIGDGLMNVVLSGRPSNKYTPLTFFANRCLGETLTNGRIDWILFWDSEFGKTQSLYSISGSMKYGVSIFYSISSSDNAPPRVFSPIGPFYPGLERVYQQAWMQPERQQFHLAQPGT